MKVVLLKNIKGTGQAGEIKDVKDGYAYNFLLPQKLARPATKSDLARKSFKSNVERRQEKKQSQFFKLKGQLDGYQINLKLKADKNGKLFGSVNAKKISGELKDRGFEIEERVIKSEPIKEVGDHQIELDFGEAGKATLKVKIDKE